MKRSLLVVAGIGVAALVSACAPEEGFDGDDMIDEENLAFSEEALAVTAPDSVEATGTPSAVCGSTWLTAALSVRSGSGSWGSYGVLPAGPSVAHTSCGVFKYYLGNTYIQILNKNPNYPGITYGWVLNSYVH